MKWMGAIIGAVEVGVGIFTGNIALVISGAMMIAGNVATVLLAPSPPQNTRQAAQLTLQLGEVPRQAIFGEAACAGSLVDCFNYGGTYGTDWEVQIRALADHYCEGLTGVWVNDKLESFTGDGAVSGYSGQLEIYFRQGDLVQTLPSVVTANGPGWSSSDYGAGVCYIVLCYKADAPDAKNPVWPGGRPTFIPVVKGKRCYDARKDSTVTGGSGTHRWATPSTWEWTDNLIVCRYNWARGVYAGDQVDKPEMLLVGRGLSATEQPPANVAAPANVCDELVGGQKIYRADGVLNAGQKHLDVESEFAAACGGQMITRDGAVEIEPGEAKTPSFFFTDDDLVSASQVSWNQGLLSEADTAWVNTVVANYIEPDQKWQSHGAPVRRDVTDITADGGPREQTLVLDLVRRVDQAGMVAEFARRLGRLWGRGTVTLGPRFAEVEEGDWGQWTSQRHFNGATKTFRVGSFKVDEKWQNTLNLQEIATTVFASVPTIADASGTYGTLPPPSLSAPAAGDWTLAPTAVDGLPALSLTGAVSMSGVQAIVFEARAYNVANGPDDHWVFNGTESPLTTSKGIGTVAGSTQFEVSIRYRVSGELTPRRVLGPVTTSDSALTGALATLSSIAADNVLSKTEKLNSLIPLNADLQSRYTDLKNRASTLAISTANLDGQRANWLNYLASLSPAWNDTTQDTTIYTPSLTAVFPGGWANGCVTAANGPYNTFTDNSSGAFEALEAPTLPATTGTTYAVGIVVKKSATHTTNWGLLRVGFRDGGGAAFTYIDVIFNPYTGFSLATGTGSLYTGTSYAAEVTDIGNEWFIRITDLSAPAGAVSTFIQIYPAVSSDGDTFVGYNASGQGSIDIKGAPFVVVNGDWWNLGRYEMMARLAAYGNEMTALGAAISGRDGTTSVIIDPPADVIIYADSTGTVKTGQLEKDVGLTASVGTANVTALGTWSMTTTSGITATIGASTGILAITGFIATEVYVPVSFAYNGVNRDVKVHVVRKDDQQSVSGGTGSGGGGGGTGGTTGTSSSLGNTSGTSYNSTSLSPVISAQAGSNGRVDLTANIAFIRTTNALGTTTTAGKWRWRVVGGTFADVASETANDYGAVTSGGGGDPVTRDTGGLFVTTAKTGLTNGTTYEFQFDWRRVTGAVEVTTTSATMTAAGS